MSSGVYRIVNVVNGKFYLGSSKCIEKRWAQHKSDLRAGRHHSVYLQRAWDKYGECSFTWQIIENVEGQFLLKTEQQWLDKLSCCDFTVGYNASYLAGGGDNISCHPNYDDIVARISASNIARYANMDDEQKRQLSESVTGDKNPNFGKKWPAELRQRMSEKRKGHSPKHVDKFLQAGRDWWSNPENIEITSEKRKGVGNSFYGKVHTELTKEKLSEGGKKRMAEARNKGMKLAANSCAVIISGVKYSSAAEASRALGVNRQTVLNRVRNPKFPDYEFET